MSRFRAVLAGVLLLLWAPPTWSQPVLGLRYRTAEVGFDFAGQWLDYAASSGERRLTYQEWLRLSLAGVVVDGRILNFAIGLRPALAQRSSARATDDVDTRQFGLDAGLNLLPTKPVSLSLAALRSSGTTSGEFGTLSDFRTAELSSRLTWRNAYLPAFVEYSQRSRENTWRPARLGQVFRLAETVRTIQLSARNSKTGLLLERMAFDDREGQRDFTAYRANLDHVARWGKRSRLASSIEYLDRSGSSPYERVVWTEAAHLQHTWKLSSDHRYRIFSLETIGAKTRGRSASMSGSYQIQPYLGVGVQLYGQSTHFEGGRASSYGAGPRLSFFANMPFQGVLSGGFSLGFQRERRETSDGFVPVVNEPHVVEASERFFLDSRFPDPGSVVITSSDETIVYVADADYRLVVTQPLIEVLVLPGSRIQQGDTVLVDYRYELLPSERLDVLFGGYNVDLSVRGFRLFHRRMLRDGRVLEGPGLSLTDYDDSTTGLRFDRSTRVGSLALEAERRRYKSDGFDFTTYLIRAVATRVLRPNLNAAFGASGSSTRAEERRINVVSGNSSLTWYATPALRLRGRGGAWVWKQEGAGQERFLGGGLDAGWSVGLVQLELRYDYNVWDVAFSRAENLLSFHLVRRF